jgi:hypothetical protein
VLNMDKEHINIQIKIHIQDGGSLEKNKEKAHILIVKAQWNLLENGKITLFNKVDGYSQMEHIIKENSLIINLMVKAYGIILIIIH